MPHQTSWYMPDRVLLVKMTQGITVQEAQQIGDEAYALMEAGDKTQIIYMIFDFRDSQMQDKLWSYSHLKLKTSERRGRTIIVGEPHLWGIVMAMLARMANFYVRFEPSLRDALSTIARLDAEVGAYVAQDTNLSTQL